MLHSQNCCKHKKQFLCNVLAFYSMTLSNRVSDALIRSKTALGMLAIKPLEVPRNVFNEWTRKQLLACVKGGYETRKVTTKFIITDMEGLKGVIDPTCLQV